MKLSASKFNEKNVFRQFQKKNFSKMSAVLTGVRAYMDATPLVFGNEKNAVYPLRISDHYRKNNINLLLISDKEKKALLSYKKICRLLLMQVSDHIEEMEFCFRCLNHFPKLAIPGGYCSIQLHISDCRRQAGDVCSLRCLICFY